MISFPNSMTSVSIARAKLLQTLHSAKTGFYFHNQRLYHSKQPLTRINVKLKRIFEVFFSLHRNYFINMSLLSLSALRYYKTDKKYNINEITRIKIIFGFLRIRSCQT